MFNHQSTCMLALALAAMVVLSGCDNAPGDASKTTAGNDANSAITVSDLGNAKNTDGLCVLDQIDGVVANSWTVKKSAPAKLDGWVSSSTKQVPLQFMLVLKGEQVYGFAGKAEVARPDVAQALNSPALATSGFSMIADFSSVQPGVYQALALNRVASGNEFCNFQRQITVTP